MQFRQGIVTPSPAVMEQLHLQSEGCRVSVKNTVGLTVFNIGLENSIKKSSEAANTLTGILSRF